MVIGPSTLSVPLLPKPLFQKVVQFSGWRCRSLSVGFRSVGLQTPFTEKTVNTCIIIVEIEMEGTTTVLGALADSVQEVLDLEPDQIEPAPKLGSKMDTEFIKGIGKQDNKFVILLDINKMFSADELASVENAAD